MKLITWIPVLALGIATLPAADELATQNLKARKYHQVLVSRPEPGYLFDRFYNTWLDGGTIASLEGFLKAEIATSPTPQVAGANHLLLAFFYTRQGEQTAAITQFRAALQKLPGSPEVLLQMAQVEARTLDLDRAITHLDEALTAKPDPELAKEILELQGSLHARDGDRAAALATWEQLLAQNPRDEELREDLIELQVSEGLLDEAIQSATALIAATKDPYKSVLRQMRLAQIHQLAERSEEAVDLFAACLDRVGAGTWLEREIFAQIEAVFRRGDDLSGLKDFYAKLLEKDGRRLTLLRKNAELLAELDETAAAIGSFREVLAITPGDRGLREAFIDMLGSLGKLEEALEQLETLAAQAQDDTELLLQQADLRHRLRQPEACATLLARFLERSAGEEADHLRVCRLLQRYGMRDAADAAFAAAVGNFPDSPTTLDAQANYLHTTGRKPQAIAIWQQLAAGAEQGRLLQVARSLAGRGENQAAFDLLLERLDDFREEPLFLVLLCEQAMRLRKHAIAVPWARELVRLSAAGGDLDLAINRAARITSAARRTDALIGKLVADPGRTPEETCLLAELYEMRGESERATGLLASIAADRPLLANRQLSRLHEQRGDWLSAAKVTEKVLDLPGGRKSTEIRRVIELAQRAGDFERALKWLPEWKKISPSSESPWLVEARIHELSGETAEAIRTLRIAAQEFDGSIEIRSRLAKIYIADDQLADAERIYQRLYDEAEKLDDKLRWTARLATVCNLRNTTQDLISRFEARRRGNPRSLTPLRALAEIHRISGNYAERREMLHAAARLKPEDIGLLHEIAEIEAAEGDSESALATLQRAAAVDRTPGTRNRIARLYFDIGRDEEAFAIIGEVAAEGQLDARALEGIALRMADALSWSSVLEFLAPYLASFPDDYRLSYLNAVALEEVGETELAIDAQLALLSGQRDIPGLAPRAPSNDLFSIGSYNQDRKRIIPPGANQVLETLEISPTAYHHRVDPDSANLWGRSPSSTKVILPSDLDELRAFAFSHLYGIGQGCSDEQLAALKAEMRREGFRSPHLLFEIPLAAALEGWFTDCARDLLVLYPDDTDAIALAILDIYVGDGSALEPAQIERAFQRIKERWPAMAVILGMHACAYNEPRLTPIIDEAIEIGRRLERPGEVCFGFLYHAVGSASTGERSAEHRRAISELLVEWFPAMRTNTWVGFYFSETVSILSQDEDTDLLVSFLDREYAFGVANPGFHGSPSFPYRTNLFPITPSQALLTPLEFPPIWLPSTPGYVLDFFNSSSNAVGFIIEEESANPVNLLAASARVESPILRVYMLHNFEATTLMEREIEALAAIEQPDLATTLLLAAHEATSGSRNRAIGRLVAAQSLPISKEVRELVDASIVSWVLEAIDANGEALDTILPAGRAAALRLRRSANDLETRTALAAVLEKLGLGEESAELLARAIPPTPATSGGQQSVWITPLGPVQQSPVEQIMKLLQNDKKDQATHHVTIAMRMQIQTLLYHTSAQPTVSDDWTETSELISAAELTDAALATFHPGEAPNARRWVEFGVAHELFGREGAAVEAYAKALALDPGNQLAITRYVPTIAFSDPDAAVELLLKLRPRYLDPAAQAILDQIPDSEDGENVARLISSAQLAVRLLQEHPGLRHSQLGWVEEIAARAGRHVRLMARVDELEENDPRTDAYTTLVDAMLETPQLAYEAFDLHASRHRDDEGNDDAVAATARQTLLIGDRNPPPSDPFSIDHDWFDFLSEPAENFVVRHAMRHGQRPELVTFASELRAAGKFRSAEDLEYLAALAFEEGDAFVQAAQAFARARPGGYSNQSTPVSEAVVRLWAARTLDVDISAWLLDRVAESRRMSDDEDQITAVVEYAAAQGERGGFAAVDAFLDRLVEVGETEWLFDDMFILMRAQPALTINALQFRSKHFPDDEIAEDPYDPFGGLVHEVVDSLPSPFGSDASPDELIDALRGSPFFCPLEEFRSFPLPRDVGGSGFAQVITSLALLEPAGFKAVKSYVEQQPASFGRDLALAAATGSPEVLYGFLARHRAQIETLAEERQAEFAALSYSWPSDGAQLPPAAADLYRYFEIIRPGGEREQRRSFLALETHPKTADLGVEIVELTRPLLADRREEAHRLFAKAAELWEKNPSRTVLDGTSHFFTWAQRIASDRESADALAFTLELIASPAEPQVTGYHADWVRTRLSSLALLPQSKASPADALLAAVERLAPHVRMRESMPLLAGVVIEFLRGATAAERVEAVARLEAAAAQSPLAFEFARAATLLTTQPDFDHYLAYMDDPAVALTARLGVYAALDSWLGDGLPDEFTRGAARLIAQSWREGSPVPHSLTEVTIPKFNLLPSHDEAWLATGRELAAHWDPLRSGSSVPITSHLLAIALESGDSATAAKICSPPEKPKRPDASWVQVLTKHRQFALAREVLERDWQSLGFTRSTALAFDEDYLAAVDELLPTIEAPELRFAASLILAAATDRRIADPQEAEQRRIERIVTASRGYPDAGVRFVPNQRHLLALIASVAEAADAIPDSYAEQSRDFEIADYQTGMRTTVATDPAWQHAQIYLAHVRQRFALEGAPAVIELFDLLAAALPPYKAGASRVGIEAGGFILALRQAMLSAPLDHGAENLRQIAARLRGFLARYGKIEFQVPAGLAADDVIVYEDFEASGLLLLISALADDADGLQAWREKLTGRASIRYNGASGTTFYDAMGTLAALCRVQEIPVGVRIRLSARILADPVIATFLETEPEHAAGIPGLLVEEQIFSEVELLDHGLEIAASAPGQGQFAADLARRLELHDRLDQASAAWDLAVASARADGSDDAVAFIEGKAMLEKRIRGGGEHLEVPEPSEQETPRSPKNE